MARSEALRIAAENSVRELAGEAPAIRRELRRILESSIFGASHRSQEFLNYIVEKALDGRFDELKERAIGSSLFGRAPDYDTGADSIVRVVANEARRRLQQFYSKEGLDYEIRIDLPPGSYILNVHRPVQPLTTKPAPPVETAPVAVFSESLRRPRFVTWIWPLMAGLLAAFSIWLSIENRQLRKQLPEQREARLGGLPQPWSALFQGDRGVDIVLADTSVGGIQNILKERLSLSDYVNHRYIPDKDQLDPKIAWFVRFLASNQYTSASYATTAVRIAQLAQSYGSSVSVSYAREMSLRTFKGGGNFVVLGTSRANPWAQLFESQLNFALEFGDEKEPVFRNRTPRHGELPAYVASSQPGTLRESFGQIAFLPSLFQGGHILFVTGTNSQATEAAGEFVTDLIRLKKELVRTGINSGANPRGFEILLRVRHTAGDPVRSEIIAVR
jgi:hypothetical protein